MRDAGSFYISAVEGEVPAWLQPERLPENGLPWQLGYVGLTTDAFLLADFKRLREEQRSAVNASLQEMVQYVRTQASCHWG